MEAGASGEKEHYEQECNWQMRVWLVKVLWSFSRELDTVGKGATDTANVAEKKQAEPPCM